DDAIRTAEGIDECDFQGFCQAAGGKGGACQPQHGMGPFSQCVLHCVCLLFLPLRHFVPLGGEASCARTRTRTWLSAERTLASAFDGKNGQTEALGDPLPPIAFPPRETGTALAGRTPVRGCSW